MALVTPAKQGMLFAHGRYARHIAPAITCNAPVPSATPEKSPGVLRCCPSSQLQVRRGRIVPDTLGRQSPDEGAGGLAGCAAVRAQDARPGAHDRRPYAAG